MYEYIRSKIADYQDICGRTPTYILVRNSDWDWFVSELARTFEEIRYENMVGKSLFGLKILIVKGTDSPIEII